ncbi:MAG: proton-conducting transporter transmembrane domain-containing protein [Acidimicrobiales bacterium]
MALLVIALSCWGLGAAVDLAAGPARTPGRVVPYLAGVAGGVVTCALGVRAVLGASQIISLGASLGVGPSSLRVDPLAGLFLTLIGALAAAISASLVSWARPVGRITSRGSGAGYLLLLGSVVVVVLAGDAFSFLFGWESLTAAFYVVSAVARRDGTEVRASWVTLGMGKVSGAALLIGMLLLSGAARSFTFTAWHGVGPGALRAAAWVLLVVGFAAKVGLLPLQVWIPLGYPAAQGPIRAAMAGLAANVGFYGLWRFLGVLGRPPVALAVVVLVVGGLTALVGIVFAAVQARLPRLVAYSSIENAGIIFVGYGIALAGAATGRRELLAVGLLAASLQVLAHAVAKSALFAASAFFEAGEGTDSLDELVGVGHRYPWSGTCFSLGCLALAGLPPTIGFVSEWFILESLMQEYRLHSLALRLGMAAGGALVALTAGVAVLCFIRVIGLSVLRRPSRVPAPGPGAGVFGRAGLGMLGLSCLGLATVAPLVVAFLSDGLAPVVNPRLVEQARVSPWVLQPVFGSFSKFSPPWLYVTMPVAFVAVAGMAVAASKGRLLRIRRVPAWRSASGGVSGPDRYSSFGYANILRHVLSNVLSARREVVVVGSADHERIHEPSVEVRTSVVEPVETYLYRPARALFLWCARQARRLQSGRLDAYIAYMLAALIVVIAVVAAHP